MNTTSLINDIIKEPGINFRGIALGDPISDVEKKEGPYAEKKLYSNPFLRYEAEIGEMEEIHLYYNFEEADELVKEITLHLTHYPDFYWAKEGHTDMTEFWARFEKSELQPYSSVFNDTVNDVVRHFTDVFKKEPVIKTKDSVFKEPYHQFKCFAWDIENEARLSVMTYADDSDYRTIKNTMKIWFRPF